MLDASNFKASVYEQKSFSSFSYVNDEFLCVPIFCAEVDLVKGHTCIELTVEAGDAGAAFPPPLGPILGRRRRHRCCLKG